MSHVLLHRALPDDRDSCQLFFVLFCLFPDFGEYEDIEENLSV